MSFWFWSLVGIGMFLLVYAALVHVLVLADRRDSARALAGFIRDCVVLCGRLLRDPRVPRRRAHWPGPESTLALVLRLAN